MEEKTEMRNDLTFSELRLANMLRQREWDPDNRIGILWRSNEVMGEIGELEEVVMAVLFRMASLSSHGGLLANLIKKLERERLGLPGSRADMEAIKEEIGGVVACLDLLAMTLGLGELGKITADEFNRVSEKMRLSTRFK